jgi:kynurenine formamidase
MAEDRELVPEAVLEDGGVKVSKSPWGPDDEIGRLNWITPETNAAILGHLDGRHVFDLNVEYFLGMAGSRRRSAVRDLDDPRPGNRSTTNSRDQGHVHEVHVPRRLIHMYTHCGTYITPPTISFLWQILKRLEAGLHPCIRSRAQGGADNFPPVSARGVLLDVAGMLGVDTLEPSYAVTVKDIQDTIAKQGVTIEKGNVVLIRTGQMRKWPDFDGYLVGTPGLGLAACKWLCEEAGAMCIAGDTIGLEVLPSEEPDVFLPIHAYMFATAGAQIIEVVDMEEIAAEKQYEFAFLGMPLKLRGATGAPMPSYAVPLKS